MIVKISAEDVLTGRRRYPLVAPERGENSQIIRLRAEVLLLRFANAHEIQLNSVDG
jgi:hypothetical protein